MASSRTDGADNRERERSAAAVFTDPMSEFVKEIPEDPNEHDAHGVDLVEGDAPAIRLLIRGELPGSLEHEGRTWVATGETHDAGDGPDIAVFRPAG